MNEIKHVAILKSIQSKHIGTAEEHNLLCDLIMDEEEALKFQRKEHIKELSRDREILRTEIERACALSKGREIDSAVYCWLSSGKDGWSMVNLVRSLIGRGLTGDDLLLIHEELVKHGSTS